MPTQVSAASEINDKGVIYLALIILIMVLVTLTSLGLVIAWSRRQDELNHMTFFCIRHLIRASSIEEKCEAAKALAHANNPIAILVLVGVFNDKELVEEVVRKTALDSLYTMRKSFKKYKKLLKSLIPALENQQHEIIIELLSQNFEKKGKQRLVQSAYVIAREYILLKHYDEAKFWLEKASQRRNDSFYCNNEIEELIAYCNEQLYQVCDQLFHNREYFKALECYSLTTSSLDKHDKHHFRSHLRIACSYCKLQRYNDAKQAILLALQYHEQTDDTLSLNKYIQELENTENDYDRRQIQQRIEQIIDEIMLGFQTK